MTKTPARIAYEAALKGVKKGGGRYPVASKGKRMSRDGKLFDSAGECAYYEMLLLRQRAGEISEIKTQVPLVVNIHGHKLCGMKIDFSYRENDQIVYVEFKSSGTRKERDYKLRKKAVELYHFIKIVEAA